MRSYRLRKNERLNKKKLIEKLFEEAHAFNSYPFRILYHVVETSSETPHRVLFSVPKKNIRQAVCRNKIKRRTKEAYRLQKQRFPETPKLLIGFLYIAKNVLSYDYICKAVVQTAHKLRQRNLIGL